jgi:hypothetical protein
VPFVATVFSCLYFNPANPKILQILIQTIAFKTIPHRPPATSPMGRLNSQQPQALLTALVLFVALVVISLYSFVPFVATVFGCLYFNPANPKIL